MSMIKNWKIYLLGVLTLSASGAFAENDIRLIDSLNQLISVQTGSERLQTLLALSEAYRIVSYDKSMKTGWEALTYADEQGFHELKALVLKSLGQSAQNTGDYDLASAYFEKALEAYEYIGNKEGIADIHILLGILLQNTSEYEVSIQHLQQAISIANDLKNDTIYLAATNGLGASYYETGKFNEAMDAYYQVQILSKKMGDTLKLGISLMNSGMIYWQWDQNNKAIDYLKQALEIFETQNSFEYLSMAYNNLGLIFFNDKNEPDTAYLYFNKSLAIRETLGNPISIANVLLNMANVYSSKDNFEKAEPVYFRALQIYESSTFIQGIIRTFFHLGEAYYKAKKYELSIDYLEKCLHKANEYNIGYYNTITSELLMKNFIATNDFPSFLKYFEIFKVEHDSLVKQNNLLLDSESDFKYKLLELYPRLTELEAENKRLADQTRFYNYIFASIIGILGFALLGLLLYKMITLIKKNNKSREEQRLVAKAIDD